MRTLGGGARAALVKWINRERDRIGTDRLNEGEALATQPRVLIEELWAIWDRRGGTDAGRGQDGRDDRWWDR